MILARPYLLLWMLLLLAFVPEAAWAQLPPGTCTTDSQYAISTPAPGSGMVSQLVSSISSSLTAWLATTYTSIAASGYVGGAVAGGITLYVVIYGIYLTFGLVPMNLADMVLRLAKISIIALFVSPISWTLFSTYVVDLFNGAVDYFLNAINAIAVGLAPGLVAGAPFAPIDNAITLLLSARMIVTLIGFAFTGPYGAIFAGLVGIGVIMFARCVVEALWVYLMSLIVRTLLLALAPVFVPTLLFSRTRHLFDGWLNQILNTCFQPIFIFTFFGLFVKLVEASIWRMLYVPICWTPMRLYAGTPFLTHFWRPTINEGGQWVLYSGDWTVAGPTGGGPIFPLNIIEVGIFLVITVMALRFNTVAINAAKEIAGASTSLNVIGGLPNFFKQLAMALTSPSAKTVAAAATTGAATALAVTEASKMQGQRPPVGGMVPLPGGGAPAQKSPGANPQGAAPGGAPGAAGRPPIDYNAQALDAMQQAERTLNNIAGRTVSTPSALAKREATAKKEKDTRRNPEQASSAVGEAMALLETGRLSDRLEALKKLRQAKDLTDQGAAGHQQQIANQAKSGSKPGEKQQDQQAIDYRNASVFIDRSIKAMEQTVPKEEPKPGAFAEKAASPPAQTAQAAAAAAKAKENKAELDAIKGLSMKDAQAQLRREEIEAKREYDRMNREVKPLEKEMQKVAGMAKKQGMNENVEKAFEKTNDKLNALKESSALKNYMADRHDRLERMQALKERIGELRQKELDKRAEQIEKKAADKAKPMGEMQQRLSGALMGALRGDKVAEDKVEKSIREQREKEAKQKMAAAEAPVSEAEAKYQKRVGEIVARTQAGLVDPQRRDEARDALEAAKAKLAKTKNAEEKQALVKEVALARRELNEASQASHFGHAMGRMRADLLQAKREFERDERQELLSGKKPILEAKQELPPAEALVKEKADDAKKLEPVTQKLADNIRGFDDLARAVNNVDSPAKEMIEKVTNLFSGSMNAAELIVSFVSKREAFAGDAAVNGRLDEYESVLDKLADALSGEGPESASLAHNMRRSQERLAEMQQAARAMEEQLKASMKQQQAQAEQALASARQQKPTFSDDDENNPNNPKKKPYA